jgi:hypothetical protein
MTMAILGADISMSVWVMVGGGSTGGAEFAGAVEVEVGGCDEETGADVPAFILFCCALSLKLSF